MSENIYESRRLVEEYLLFHYGEAEDVLSWAGGPQDALRFPERVARYLGEEKVRRALDVGAGVGRSSYVLSEFAAEVVSIDYSLAFIEAAGDLAEKGKTTVSRLIEGRLRDEVELKKPQQGDSSRITFMQGDAMNLPRFLGSFDRVLAANLICRLSDPMKFLERLPSLVNEGGEVVLATPCTWLEEFTPPENFPEGRTIDWLKEVMGRDFSLVKEGNEPFLIRETARKFQWTVSHVTHWKKRVSA